MTTRNYGNVTVDHKAYWTNGLHDCHLRTGRSRRRLGVMRRRRGVTIGVGVWTAASFCATSISEPSASSVCSYSNGPLLVENHAHPCDQPANRLLSHVRPDGAILALLTVRRRIRRGGDLQGGVICRRCNAKAVNLAGGEL